MLPNDECPACGANLGRQVWMTDSGPEVGDVVVCDGCGSPVRIDAEIDNGTEAWYVFSLAPEHEPDPVDGPFMGESPEDAEAWR